MQNVKLKLRDIPEMNYMSSGTAEDPTPKGEVMFWGPSIMEGYFKNPEKTAESFHNGWLLSGDVGLVYPNGALKIIDRAKNIFKLSQGEYIAPEKLENVYVKSSWVAQVWIHGDSLQNNVIAFVVPEIAPCKVYAAEKGITYNEKEEGGLATLFKDQGLKQAVLDDMCALAVGAKFNSLEKPCQLYLLEEPFTIENDFLTPTMKMKRNIAKAKLADKITELYDMPIMKPTKK